MDGQFNQRPRVQQRGTECPHLDRNDLRCSSRLSLGHLDQAFNVCLGSFHACPMYHRLNRELTAEETELAEQSPLVTITAHGRTLSLRPTGS